MDVVEVITLGLLVIYGKGYSSNTVIIKKNDGEVIVVDPGMPDNVSRVIQAIKRITKESLRRVILSATHEHYDHIGGFAELCRKVRCEIYVSKSTADVLKAGDDIISVAYLFNAKLESIQVQKVIKEGDCINSAIGDFTVIETPGHTIGSICFYNKPHKILISGDTVFPHGGFGRVDLHTGNIKMLKSSIEKLSSLDVEILIPGHGRVIKSDGKRHVLLSFENIKKFSDEGNV
ncbi:MAG: MBL fold metallo-hydrolase [Candidatus Odinarchaeota archaeon]|nr:MBL fold metallo-hydrolase [Candidatus Odinarchaeota archaeon]